MLRGAGLHRGADGPAAPLSGPSESGLPSGGPMLEHRLHSYAAPAESFTAAGPAHRFTSVNATKCVPGAVRGGAPGARRRGVDPRLQLAVIVAQLPVHVRELRRPPRGAARHDPAGRRQPQRPDRDRPQPSMPDPTPVSNVPRQRPGAQLRRAPRPPHDADHASRSPGSPRGSLPVILTRRWRRPGRRCCSWTPTRRAAIGWRTSSSATPACCAPARPRRALGMLGRDGVDVVLAEPRCPASTASTSCASSARTTRWPSS